MTDYRSIITLKPGKRGGKPCVPGLRITVQDVLGWLASGMSAAYPRPAKTRRAAVFHDSLTEERTGQLMRSRYKVGLGAKRRNPRSA